jgi:hypothetical protein
LILWCVMIITFIMIWIHCCVNICWFCIFIHNFRAERSYSYNPKSHLDVLFCQWLIKNFIYPSNKSNFLKYFEFASSHVYIYFFPK